MDCTTTTQLVTVGVLAFFMGGLVSFFCAVFVMAQRLPPREPPHEVTENLSQEALDDFHAWQRRQRLSLASRATTQKH